ncbi:MAG TPA: Maf family nucleotide pyrophosphatase [Steroidobacteraceae bacterium]|nr:Maf family nucleotide pyrophosphatase [Steroidobacteraceae bacterium]
MPADKAPLILASTSPYRRELLARLRLPFSVEAPGVEEARLAGEAGAGLAARLARAKAAAVAARHPGAVVIGSDQVAECQGRVLGKPHTAARARDQLAEASGATVLFHTAVALVHADGATVETHTDLTRVRFRRLGADEIARYVALDEPLDCAGSFRAEALGVALFEAVESEDPTGLVGLPLIWVAAALRRAGLSALDPR